ncbi:hypothetical protein [Maribellus sp. YY47]|uniref:hypothetical protein n=1 Tax=Maribellus sp. YY47 TaxID=2929486 RepID=UPI0020014DDE|nr:hypothetical protein [Maribellus sp. YY47]MCK3683089.1 hypothetical protein [Maribellus sp. YY47]
MMTLLIRNITDLKYHIGMRLENINQSRRIHHTPEVIVAVLDLLHDKYFTKKELCRMVSQFARKDKDYLQIDENAGWSMVFF